MIKIHIPVRIEIEMDHLEIRLSSATDCCQEPDISSYRLFGGLL